MNHVLAQLQGRFASRELSRWLTTKGTFCFALINIIVLEPSLSSFRTKSLNAPRSESLLSLKLFTKLVLSRSRNPVLQLSVPNSFQDSRDLTSGFGGTTSRSTRRGRGRSWKGSRGSCLKEFVQSTWSQFFQQNHSLHGKQFKLVRFLSFMFLFVIFNLQCSSFY